jgi:hypothetical protein
MGYIAIKDKNWGSATSGKKSVTVDDLAELEKNMLKRFEALHKKKSTSKTKGKGKTTKE